jgi:hypothetical protein
MCTINCYEVEEGLIPTEKVVRLRTADGRSEEVVVSNSQLVGRRIIASEIGRERGNVLIELPRESSSGRWRVWVSENEIG